MVLEIKFLVPLYPAGQEPSPPGLSSDELQAWEQTKKMEKFIGKAQESCIVKSAISGGMGFGMGAFFSMMSTSFAYDDPLSRTDMSTKTKTIEMFKDMGRGMWRTGRSFGKVGALYSGIECIIESYRAKNDMTNAVAGGFVTGAILARNSGPRGALAGAVGFMAFSAAIETFLRRETSDDD
ncbi:Mitochondrial import inner membrane translocase subunit TIM22 [Serendipita indica DSM 11827]|uniref:Mitochondrial import inner membrane translocase subunit TIM22 n=1 Tax=Serendipita indica (strain DSM 11827) TaxID=1109443 RepID=G4TC85_SERID|nr:Mitochondrial import inner membrane translocase subunit TIM22 [Serendipita indica DSM 11827]CCA68936.1 related to Tim22, mitochondrial import inner membrane translocase subunit [Serendipita indica DSM 11827]